MSSLLLHRKEYPVITKNMVRQRLLSSHSHLAGKLGAGVLTGHSQVLSAYQCEGGLPLSNSEPQEPMSTHFPQSREPGLLYHCFKHRGKLLAAVHVTSWASHNTDDDCITLQIMADTRNSDASARTWRQRP